MTKNYLTCSLIDILIICFIFLTNSLKEQKTSFSILKRLKNYLINFVMQIRLTSVIIHNNQKIAE